MAALDDPSNPHATPAENARFSAFDAALKREGFSPITRACYASDWWTVSEHAHRATGRRFRLGSFTADGFALQRAEHAARGVSPATLNRRLSFLRRYSAFSAAAEPALRETAAAFAALPFQAVPKQARRALSHADEQRVRAAADAQGPSCRALVALLLGTGLRSADAASLTRGDVIGPPSAPTALRVRGPRAKTVLLGPFAQTRIRELLDSSPGRAETPLFRAKSGAALGEDGIAALVQRAARDAGVDASPRTLRHTFAVRYLSEHRDDLDGLAHALGHTSLAAVRSYRDEVEAGGPAVRVHRWAEFDEVTPAPGVRRRSFSGSRVRVERELLAPGTEVRPLALAAERLTIVLSGRVTIQVGSNRVAAGVGEFVTVPAGVVHGITVDGSRSAVLIHLTVPPKRAAEPSAP